MYRNTSHGFLDHTNDGHDEQIRATVHAYGYGHMGNTLHRQIYQGTTHHRPGLGYHGGMSPSPLYHHRSTHIPGYHASTGYLAGTGYHASTGHLATPLHSPANMAGNIYADLNLLRQENNQRTQVIYLIYHSYIEHR